MGKGLSQIAKAKDIYLTLDLWAMLSPKLAEGEPGQCLPKEGSHKSEKQSDEDSIESRVNP